MRKLYIAWGKKHKLGEGEKDPEVEGDIFKHTMEERIGETANLTLDYAKDKESSDMSEGE
jgi:hypothetical protein